MLHVQNFLRNGGTLTDLENKLGIKAKSHTKFPNLWLLKYSQIESPMGNPIVQECRGIILDESDGWQVVARGFDRFFNYGEGHAAKIDWNSDSIRVQEKVDGSLCLVFYYKKEWHVATTGTPDASGDVNGSGINFANYFWDTFKNCCQFSRPTIHEKDFCFMFELTGPLNRIVVPHTKANLTLLGARKTSTWEEVHPSEVARFFSGIPAVKEFPLKSIEDIHATFDTISPLQQEGYVIVDERFNRIKIKHPEYVTLHHAKSGWTDKTCVECIRSGELSELTATVLKTYPEYQPMFNDAKQRYDTLLTAIEAEYAMYRNIPVQKDFALAVKNCRCSGALFQLRAGKVKSIREFLAKCHIDTIMTLLGY